MVAISLNSFAQSIPSYIPTNGLIGWYPFNGNANDESGNGNNGTVTNATLTTDRFSNNNTAYYFNGNANIVSTISTLPVGNNSRTMSAWVKWDSVQAVWDNSIACYGSCPAYSNGGSWGLRIWDTSGAGNAGNAIVNLYGCGTGDAKSHFHPNKNWHNIIGIYNGSVQKLYVDGVFVKSLNYTLNTILSQFVIGASENLTITHGNFKGTIDDIGIWNRVLTQQEISSIYNSSPCTQLVYDTITFHDTITTHLYVHDTLTFKDTLTTHLYVHDTLTFHDTITTHLFVHDTITVNDTIKHYLAVTDTLLINAVLTGVPLPNNTNLIKVYPNPAKDHIYINFGNYTAMSGYSVKITNALSQTVYSSAITQQQSYLDLSTWTGKGTYFIQILNGIGTTIETLTIILQ